MESNKVDMFMMMNAKFFPSEKLIIIKQHLDNIDDSRYSLIQMIQYKDPTTSLLVSIFAGTLGIDRFMIGDTGLGIGKLLTCGGLGVWHIVDMFLIMGATREKNFDSFMQMTMMS